MNKKRERQILRVFYAFLLLIFFAHIFACFLVVLGEDDDEYRNQYMWIPVNAGLWGEQPEETVTSVSHPGEVYVFAQYWVWEVITTVGYGDRTIPINDYNIADVIFTFVIEFVGVLMQALVINVMTDFVGTSYSFSALVNEKLEPVQLWINKI